MYNYSNYIIENDKKKKENMIPAAGPPFLLSFCFLSVFWFSTRDVELNKFKSNEKNDRIIMIF